MTFRNFMAGMAVALRHVHLGRLVLILLAALVAGLVSDWLRRDRVVFAAPLPEFRNVPAS